ncbi:hypothetical protein VFPPC_16293 [Pochonia chlamydosporia 170]|uniref:Uncharacterized protein n=1 Tax=Pochonia chlamydosporia 170 TaxID=1380566 RepID=A0A179FID4_METCM|nr:hypothetical protein VFPPC_16293 [Pochonia chlamydosporia 170]OAQ65001.1 hypothetical protein VFPPC_16293 [Pochonia chlamydosporia 170]
MRWRAVLDGWAHGWCWIRPGHLGNKGDGRIAPAAAGSVLQLQTKSEDFR